MKKKVIISIIVAALVLGSATAYTYFFTDLWGGGESVSSPDGMTAPVSSVASIAGIGNGMSNQTKFSGVIEPQSTEDIQKDENKKIGTLSVATGDTVTAGQELFTYDTEDLALTIDQAKLEIETIANRMDTLQSQINELTKEKNNASSDDAMSYTLQIQSLQLDIRTEEYNKGMKEAELARLEASVSDTSVVSPIDGIITNINTTGEYDQMTGMEKPYISILSTGAYRVKGTISELHINNLMPGQSVLIRSRVDENTTWMGMIDYIDFENPNSGDQNQNFYYSSSSSSSSNTSSKYDFYVTLTDYEGLILGQHVFIELDYGTENVEKEGIWLPSYYIGNDETGDTYVMARDDDNKLEKRDITLGAYDETTDTYEITDGVTEDDFICVPDPMFTEGMETVEEIFFDTSGMMGDFSGTDNFDGEMLEGEVLEGDFFEGEVLEGDFFDGEVLEGEVFEGEILGNEVLEGEVLEGEAMPAPEEEAVVIG